MGGNGLIARSFMMMSFLTAMLLIAVQGLQETAFSSRSTRFPVRPVATNPTPVTPQSQGDLRDLAIAPNSPTATTPAPAVTSQSGSISPTTVSPNSTPLRQGGGTGGHGPRPAAASSPGPLATAHADSHPGRIPLAMGQLLGRSAGTFIPAMAELSTLLAPLPDQIMQVVVDLSDRQVYLYQGTQEVGRYPVAIGKDGWATPTGQFQVIDMRTNPHWQHPITRADVPPGPDNPLGSRWIAFLPMEDGVIGFHGTYQTELIGQAVSHGCIRMRNEDIETLFSHLTLGVPVTVRP